MGDLFDIGVERLIGGSVGGRMETQKPGTWGRRPQMETQDPPSQNEDGAPGRKNDTEEGDVKPPLQVEVATENARNGRGTFYLETFGCQMNEHDSEKVAGVLLARGYRQVETVEEAGVVLYNTCSIREKAAQKVYSRLGEFRPGEEKSGEWRVASGEQETIPQGLKPRAASAVMSDLKVRPPKEKKPQDIRSQGELPQDERPQDKRPQDPPSQNEDGAPGRKNQTQEGGVKPPLQVGEQGARADVSGESAVADAETPELKVRPIQAKKPQDPPSQDEDGAPGRQEKTQESQGQEAVRTKSPAVLDPYAGKSAGIKASATTALADSLGRSTDRPLHDRDARPASEGGPYKDKERGVTLREGQGEKRAPQAVANGGKIIGVLGCLAQQEGQRIFARAPWVSLVCGSASYRKLPELLAQLEAGNRRVTGLATDTDETFETEVTRRDNPWRAYLTIIEGCDKACSYCVVPFTRGPERSRASASILEEVRKLADAGYTEVQLLGQTVNSYADPSARKMRFSELLVAVAEVAGIRRVRFTTSHPRDFGKDIVEAMEAVPGICEHVHLPVQSGSTKVLRAMARTYTRDEYLEKIAMIRGAKREISITSDIIVGFPGETEKDFEETLSLLDVAQYDGAFSFKYSPRPNTPSLTMEDAIPEEEKSRRLAILMERQREIQRARNEKLVGKTFEVMVEGKSRREHQWSGHTSSNKVMNFTSREEESLGDYVQVRVVGATPNSLGWGSGQ